MLNRLVYLHIIFLLLLSAGLKAQLNYTTSAEETRQTNYLFNGVTDTIFLFSENNPNKYIEAQSPNNLAATFEWYSYDPGTNTYLPLSSDVDALSSRQNITQSMGYRLHITGNGNNVTSEFWVIINDLSVDIYNGEEVTKEGETYKVVPVGQKWCHLIRDINARIDSADLSYYDINNGNTLQLDVQYFVSWSADPVPEENGINDWFYNDDFRLKIDIEYPFWEDSWYYITIEDNFQFTARDSIFYESIEPHADFSYEYITLDNRSQYPNYEEPYYEEYYNSSNYDYISAPAIFKYTNLSINADTMIWSFGDGDKDVSGVDSLKHTYHMPGDYFPKLAVYNIVPHLYEPCSDTFPKYNEEILFVNEIPYPITVDKARVDWDEEKGIYNAITIPPDGINDYFRFTGDVSITDFEIVIYNRYGNKVYDFEGNIRDWEGWNGTEKSSGKEVHSGVYYYVVKSLFVLPNDSEGRKPKLVSEEDPNAEIKLNNVYRGFVHVFNSNE